MAHLGRLFGPGGAVDRLIVQRQQYRVTGPIYFLVGKWERLPMEPGGAALSEDGLANWEDSTNLWVALNSQSGLVTVAEQSNYFVDPADGQLKEFVDPTTNRSKPASVPESRRYARQAQISKGGR